MDKPKGKIKIGCTEQAGFWQFSISDNGCGIKEKNFERMFKIFQTLTDNRGFENTGVGLTVVKKIVESWNGRIWVESEYGKGSRFFVLLPIDKSR